MIMIGLISQKSKRWALWMLCGFVGNGTLNAQTTGILQELFVDVPGIEVSDLTDHSSYPSSPTSESILPSFEAATNIGDDYGQRIRGYVIAPETGDYVFWISSDDYGSLLLSTDETPDKAREIASVPGWTTSRFWERYPEQMSEPIRLMSGRRYYIEALMKERGGSDHLAVRWQLPNGQIEEPIPGNRLRPLSLGIPQILTHPQDVSTIERQSASFSVTIEREVGAVFQWQKNGLDIAGATNAVLDLKELSLSDSGNRYQVKVTNPDGSVMSQSARLTVHADILPPRLISVFNLGNAHSLTLNFSEPLDSTSITRTENYLIEPNVTVLEAKLGDDGETVILQTSPMMPGVDYRLRVQDVRDLASTPNSIEAGALSFSWDFDPLEMSALHGQSEPKGPTARTTGLAITEIHYHPRSREDEHNLEFIELFNSQAWAEDLSGYRLSGAVDFEFAEGTEIAADGYLVIAANPDDVKSFYEIEDRLVIGPFEDNLPNRDGRIRLRNRIGAVLLEVTYEDRNDWSAAADGFGHSLVLYRPSFGQDNAKSWAASQTLDGSPGKFDLTINHSYETILINEILAHTDDPVFDYIELYNYGDRDVDLSGCHLTDDADEMGYIFPEGSVIEAKGFVALDQNELGFALSSGGEAIALRAPNSGRVIDALRFPGQANGIALGRFPDGSPLWSRLDSFTFASSNSPKRLSEIVINEIMYHPIGENSEEEFLELHNRSDAEIDLSDWRVSGEIEFRIPEGTIISAGGFVVLAKNAEHLMARYSHLNSQNTLGDFGGTLSNRGGWIFLDSPDWIEVIDENGEVSQERIWIREDALRYHEGGRWGKWADGGGSSLELIDARSDNRLASNWADSDESGKSEWTSVEITGRLDNGRGALDELQILLLGGGECLVDDLFVSRNLSQGTAENPENRVSNGNFESGLDGWIIQGNHIRSSLSEAGEGYSGGHCLHLRATSGGDNGANRVETDLTTRFSNGQHATIKAKLKWLRGHPDLLLRLRGNPIELSAKMKVPIHLGTPGLTNSQARANAGPAIVGVSHSPILPEAGEAVRVVAQISDPDGLSQVVLKYRLDRNEEYQILPMRYRGASAYSAEIPGQDARRMVAFFIEARDARPISAMNQFPENPHNRECLVRFGETALEGDFGTYRLWIAFDNVTNWRRRRKLSNEPIDTTFVYGDFRAIYNTGGRFRGSPFIRPGYGSPSSSQPTAMVIVFPEDDLFLGVNKINLDGLEQPGRDNTLQRERASFWIAKQMDLPYSHQRYIRFIVNGVRKGEVFTDSQHPSSEYVDTWFPRQREGELYKIDDWFEFNDSVNREFNENARLQRYTSEGELKVARYRWSWEKKPNGGLDDDYSSLLELVEALNSRASIYEEEVESLVDVEQWMRIFAVRHIVGDWDGYGYNRGKNASTFKPEDGKWKMILWDLDFSLGGGSDGPTSSMFSVNDPTIARFYRHPAFRRAYLRAWQDAAEGPLLESENVPMLDAVYEVFQRNSVRASRPNGIKNWMRSRRNYLIRELQKENADFEISTHSGNDFTSQENVVTLAGTAPVAVKTLRVNGAEYPVNWTSVSDWEMQLPLISGENSFHIEGFDLRGESIAQAQDTIEITFTGIGQNPADHLVINEMMYHPASPGTGFVEIYNASQSHWFDLSNYRIEGLDFEFDSGFVLPAQSYAVVVEDRQAFAEHYGSSIEVAGEFGGQLATDGQTLTLIDFSEKASGERIDEVTYEAQLPWPQFANGQGASLQLIDAQSDNRRVANWDSLAPSQNPQGPQTFVAMTDVWRYHQSGDQGTRWRMPDFDDRDWQSGRALFYVENADLPSAKNTELTLGQPTYYFRKSFEANEVSNVELEVSLILDDGAVAYLNGIELFRIRMGEGEIDFQTFSSSTVTDAQLEGPFSIPATALIKGENVIAVEVHQTNPGSSDIVFGLSLIGQIRGGDASTPGQPNTTLRSAPALPKLWLNEVFPSASSWVELHNSGEVAVSLDNVFLSPNYDSPMQWQFPSGASILPGEYRLVFCDGEVAQNRDEWHTNFRLPVSSGSVVLSMKKSQNANDQNDPDDLVLVDYLNYNLRPDRSYGALPNGSPNHRQSFLVPTPAQPNAFAIPPIEIIINEWMADNVTTIANPMTDAFDDWFELYNAADAPADLSGYFLSDDPANLELFEIPMGTVISPRSFLLIWAGETARDEMFEGNLFAGFRLSRSGETLTLSAPGGIVIDQVSFGEQSPDISEGRLSDGDLSRTGILSIPTPGSSNVVEPAPNLPPILLPLPNLSVDEGERFQLNVGGFDPDGDASLLRYELAPGHPDGGSIDPNTGRISWLTNESDGPGSFAFTVLVHDSGSPSLSAMRTYGVVVAEVNQAPILGNMETMSVPAGMQLSIPVRATDVDLPSQTLRFSLLAGSPVDANIDANTGQITWQPSVSQMPGRYLFNVSVSDNGNPPLSFDRSFEVIVMAPVQKIELSLRISSEDTFVFEWQTQAGMHYEIQATDNLTGAQWEVLGEFLGDGQTLQYSERIDNARRFYRVRTLAP